MDTAHMALSKAAQEIENEQIAYEERMKMRKAAPWMPEPGTTVRATCIGMSMRDGGYGMYPVITYKKSDGEVINVHAFHQIIRQLLADLKTAPGVEQYITYLGKRRKNNPTEEEVKAGRDMYHDYDAENVGQDTVSGVAEDFTFGV